LARLSVAVARLAARVPVEAALWWLVWHQTRQPVGGRADAPPTGSLSMAPRSHGRRSAARRAPPAWCSSRRSAPLGRSQRCARGAGRLVGRLRRALRPPDPPPTDSAPRGLSPWLVR